MKKTKQRIAAKSGLGAQIRDRLEQIRLERELNYSQFANATGVKYSLYLAWRNNHATPSSKNVRKLAERLGVTSDWLLGVEHKTRPGYEGLATVKSLEQELSGYVERELVLSLSSQ